MPRQIRQKSSTGIYHVMLRGVNKQNIFFSEDDYIRMMRILRDIPYVRDSKTNEVLSSDVCTIYAYCILDNHLHILLREGTRCIADIMKIIEDRYAVYYNKKYERVGHLFQARYPSEPVNEGEYFHVLLRYIHRNSVKALEARTPEEYPYSSWNEYTSHSSNLMKVLKPEAIQAVLRKYPLEELIEWIDTEVDDRCLDMDSFRNIISDREAAEMILDLTGYTNIEDFRSLDPQTQIYYLLQAIEKGISIRQAARLGSVTRYQIEKTLSKKVGESSARGTDPVAEEKLEKKGGGTVHFEDADFCEQNQGIEYFQQKVRKIEGLSTKTYRRMHQIVEYLALHNNAKCKEIADYLGVNSERARQLLVHLSNEDIILINGQGKSSSYSLRRSLLNGI